MRTCNNEDYKTVGNEEFNKQFKSDDNQRIMNSILLRYKKILSKSEMDYCKYRALWKTLRKHDSTKGNKFTNSLYNYTIWEIRQFLADRTKIQTPYGLSEKTRDYLLNNGNNTGSYEQSDDGIVLYDIKTILDDLEYKVFSAKHIELRTDKEIKKAYGLTDFALENLLNSIKQKVKDEYVNI